MLETNAAEPDHNSALDTPWYTAGNEHGSIVRCNEPWYVLRVRALPDFQLEVEFIDGTKGRVEMREQIFSECAGVFESLRDPAAFAAVSCDEGHVEWANGLDIAPDATYDDFQRQGVQILR